MIHKTVVAAALILMASPASAQTCTGGGSFNAAPVHVGVAGAFSSGHRQLGASVGVGADRLFGAGSFAAGTADRSRESSRSLTVLIGADQPLRRDNRLHVCPLAGVEFGSSFALAAGGSAGLIVTNTRTVAIIPSVGIRFAHERAASSTATAIDARGSSASATVGIGWVFTNGFAVAPLVTIPFGFTGGRTLFGIRISYQVARR